MSWPSITETSFTSTTIFGNRRPLGYGQGDNFSWLEQWSLTHSSFSLSRRDTLGRKDYLGLLSWSGMWPWIAEGLVPLGDSVYATVIWNSLNLQSVCKVRRNHWTNSSRIQPNIRSKCSPTFSSHCKWKNLESNTKLLFLFSVVALFTDKLDSARELSSALRLTSSISFFVEICNSK